MGTIAPQLAELQFPPVAAQEPPAAAIASEAVADAAPMEQGYPRGPQEVGAEPVAVLAALQVHQSDSQALAAAELAVQGVQAAEAAVHAEDLAANVLGEAAVEAQEAGDANLMQQGLGEQPDAVDMEDDMLSVNSSREGSSSSSSSSEESSSEESSDSEGNQPDSDSVIDLISSDGDVSSSDSAADSVDGMQLQSLVSEDFDLE